MAEDNDPAPGNPAPGNPAAEKPAPESAAPLPRQRPCVICGKLALPKYRPFCSPRCADIDLGRWLKGAYVLPGAPLDEDEDDAGGPGDQRERDDG